MIDDTNDEDDSKKDQYTGTGITFITYPKAK